jgi:hypothetical protein
VKVAGIERLRLLDDLAPLADGASVFADPRGDASEWQLHFGPLTFALTLSAEVWRGFSGEGQVLSELAARDREKVLGLVQGALKWQAEIRPEEFSANWDLPTETLRQAFAALGSRGLVGYDVGRGAWFHRELPFDLALVEELHPRLKSARKLVETGGVRMLRQTADMVEVEVAGTDVTHRVRLAAGGNRCTCPWHAKHQGSRGPCKHILAAQIVTEDTNEGRQVRK